MAMIEKVMILFILGVVALMDSNEKTLFDFQEAQSAQSWQIVNDGVMGGLSESSFVVEDGRGVFRGSVSLENNGGFASVRTLIPPKAAAGFDGFRLRVKGDGKIYKLRLRTNDRFDGIAYSVDFQTQADTWQEHSFSADQFIPQIRGRIIRDAPPLDMRSVRQVGFLISDKQVGRFELVVDWIQVVR